MQIEQWFSRLREGKKTALPCSSIRVPLDKKNMKKMKRGEREGCLGRT